MREAATVATAVEEIRELLKAPTYEPPGPVRDIYESLREDRKYRLMRDVAREFGRLRGWTLARKTFSLVELAGRTDQEKLAFTTTTRVLDHAFHYRENRAPYRPAGIAVHLYEWPDVGPDVEAICFELGVHYEAILNFPSWWYPGVTQLVLYTPGRREGEVTPRVGGAGSQMILPYECFPACPSTSRASRGTGT